MIRGRQLLAACALALACALAAPAGAAAQSEDPNAIWVSPTGDDTAAGTKDAPMKSLSLALAVADALGRRTIYVMPGDHPRFRDETARGATVTVSNAPGQEPPRIYGGEIFGGTDLHFTGITFMNMLQVSNHPVRLWDQLARRITVERSTFTSTTPFTVTCMMIRNGSTTIRVRDNRFDQCRFGITGPHDGITDPTLRTRSSDIVVERNWIGPVRTDGFQFAHWEDVVIRGNVIERQDDPYDVDHTDAIQITGNTERVRILDNVISHGGQLVFVQEPFGWNRDLTIANNLVYESDNYAIKVSSTDGLRVIGNTVWRSRWAALLLRNGVTNAVVTNNALQGYGETDSPQVSYRDYNFMSYTSVAAGPHDIVGGDPRFRDPARGDFRLRRNSPLLGAAGPVPSPTGTAADTATAIGCTLPQRRSVAGQTVKLPACGPLDD